MLLIIRRLRMCFTDPGWKSWLKTNIQFNQTTAIRLSIWGKQWGHRNGSVRINCVVRKGTTVTYRGSRRHCSQESLPMVTAVRSVNSFRENETIRPCSFTLNCFISDLQEFQHTSKALFWVFKNKLVLKRFGVLRKFLTCVWINWNFATNANLCPSWPQSALGVNGLEAKPQHLQQARIHSKQI